MGGTHRLEEGRPPVGNSNGSEGLCRCGHVENRVRGVGSGCECDNLGVCVNRA